MPMKRLWAPWRMQYLEEPARSGCFFCAAVESDDERAHLVLAREAEAVVMLNKFPYGHGHLLVAPRRHAGRMEELTDPEYDALQRAVRRAAVALTAAFKPEGMNIGMNLGRHAGRRPVLVGLIMVAIGVALSAIAIQLGG